MKKIITLFIFTIFGIFCYAQISSSSDRNATCEDFVFDKGNIYITGSYENHIMLNERDSFNSNSPGTFLLYRMDTLFKNFTSLLAFSEGSFIRGKRIFSLNDGKKIIVCEMNGQSKLEKNIFESVGGWDILVLLLDNEDKLIKTYVIGSEIDDIAVEGVINNNEFNLLFKGGKNIKINNESINIPINEFGFLLFKLNQTTMDQHFYKISELNSINCFIPIAFSFEGEKIKSFGYYSSKESINKYSSIKDFGVLSGNLGRNFEFKKILRTDGLVSKTYLSNDLIVFDITSQEGSKVQSAFYCYKNGILSSLLNNIQSKYHYISSLNKIENDKYYCIGSFQNYLRNSTELLNKESDGSFIYFFDFESKESLLEEIPQSNVTKSAYENEYIFISSSYTNTGKSSDIKNSYNNFKITKSKINYMTRYEIIKKQLEDKKVLIYPNPAISSVIITTKMSYSNLELRLINENGQLVNQQYFTKNSKTFDLDIRSYPDGIYFIEFYQNNIFISNEKLFIVK